MATVAPTSRHSVASDKSYRRQRSAGQALVYLILITWCAVSLYPMALMIMNSFKSDVEMNRNPVGVPERWTIESYANVLIYYGGLWRNFLISIVVAGSSTVLGVFFSSLAAFAFAKYRFRGRDPIFVALLATLMIPHEITIPGLYLTFARVGLLNTLWALILPAMTPIIGLFLIRQYMIEIPDALIEAARIDGANHWQIYRHIMAPTSAPVLGAYAILHFQGVWNEFIWAQLAVSRRAIQPIMVVLPQLVDPVVGFLQVWGTIMAGCVLATLPIIIVFITFQDTFMSSIVIGAVKE